MKFILYPFTDSCLYINELNFDLKLLIDLTLKMSYNYITPELFNIFDKDLWKNYLDENGFVVIKNILNTTERNIFWNLFKSDFNIVAPDFDFDDSSMEYKELSWYVCKRYLSLCGRSS